MLPNYIKYKTEISESLNFHKQDLPLEILADLLTRTLFPTTVFITPTEKVVLSKELRN